MYESSSRIVFEFGPFRLIPSDGLWCEGQFVHLPPKELAVLVTLVGQYGAVVSKQELFHTVWPGDPVSDESLTRCIYVLRKLFAQHGLTYIETLHRRGYRFSGTVKVSDGVKPVEPVSLTPPKPTVNTINPEAREAFMQGMSRLHLRHPRDIEQSIRCLQRAIELEPHFTRAYVGLASAFRIALFRPSQYDAMLKPALEHVLSEALSQIPQERDARAMQAWSRAVFNHEWESSLTTLNELISADPTLWTVRSDWAFLQLCLGHVDAALNELRLVVGQNPFLVESSCCLVYALAAAGHYEAALTQARAAFERLPSMSAISGVMAYAASLCGMHDEAVAAAERATHLSDRNPLELVVLISTLYQAGDHAAAEKVYQELVGQSVWAPSSVAVPALLIEGPEACFSWLEKAHADKCYLLPIFLLDPRLEPVRQHSRYEALVASVRRTPAGNSGTTPVVPPMKHRPHNTAPQE
ncbi:MAG: winged helix-turn-helix domain-containing protein [Planctomycetaceae bacterium]|nr:winged helix-turn-helix domain-containing protein [Planctomycetaceae bacterium]